MTCWSQFMAMQSCQIGGAHSQREITGGLTASEGKLRHLGVQLPPTWRWILDGSDSVKLLHLARHLRVSLLAFVKHHFGWTGVTPLAGDWNGNGKTKIGLYSNGIWIIDYDGTGTWNGALDKIYYFGWTGVTPLLGDWSADGKTKIGIYSGGWWYLDYNGTGAWDEGADRMYFLVGQVGDLTATGRW